MPEGFVRAASLSEVPPGSLLGVELAGHRICLANTEGEVYALKDNCSHKDFPLSAGELEDNQLECAWHGARFDVESGKALRIPAVKPVKTYEVAIEDGDVWVKLS